MAARRFAVACRWTWGALAGLMLGTPGMAAAEPIKIGLVKTAGAGPIYIAKDKGYFTAENLAPELIFFTDGGSVAVATVSGDIDFGTTGLSATFFNLSSEGALRIIAGRERGMAGMTAYRSQTVAATKRAYDTGLTAFDGLRGHSIGFAQLGGPSHYALVLLAEKHGLDLKSVRFLPLQSVPNVLSAAIGGTADAVVLPFTNLVDPMRRGEVIVLAGDEETPYQGGVVWTSGRAASDRQDYVKRFLRAYRKGMRDFHDAFSGPDEERRDGATAPETLAILSNYVQQPSELLKLAVSHMDVEGRLSIPDVLHQIAWYKAQGMLKGDVDAEAIIDKRYVIPLAEQ